MSNTQPPQASPKLPPYRGRFGSSGAFVSHPPTLWAADCFCGVLGPHGPFGVDAPRWTLEAVGGLGERGVVLLRGGGGGKFLSRVRHAVRKSPPFRVLKVLFPSAAVDQIGTPIEALGFHGRWLEKQQINTPFSNYSFFVKHPAASGFAKTPPRTVAVLAQSGAFV